MRWDKKKLPESNLHMYGKDDTQIMVYSMKRSPKKGSEKKKKKTLKKKTRKLVTKKKEIFVLD